jgi:hypothetical protein
MTIKKTDKPFNDLSVRNYAFLKNNLV